MQTILSHTLFQTIVLGWESYIACGHCHCHCPLAAVCFYQATPSSLELTAIQYSRPQERKIAGKKQIRTFSSPSVGLPLHRSDWQQADEQIAEDRLTHCTVLQPWMPYPRKTVLMEASCFFLHPASTSTTNPSISIVPKERR